MTFVISSDVDAFSQEKIVKVIANAADPFLYRGCLFYESISPAILNGSIWVDCLDGKPAYPLLVNPKHNLSFPRVTRLLNNSILTYECANVPGLNFKILDYLPNHKYSVSDPSPELQSLFSNVSRCSIVDPVLYQNGDDYFLIFTVSTSCSELHVYRYNPNISSIFTHYASYKSPLNSLRSAGLSLYHENEFTLYHLCQTSTHHYGDGLVLLTLTDRPVQSIDKITSFRLNAPLIGPHTFSSEDTLFAIDASRLTFSPSGLKHKFTKILSDRPYRRSVLQLLLRSIRASAN